MHEYGARGEALALYSVSARQSIFTLNIYRYEKFSYYAQCGTA